MPESDENIDSANHRARTYGRPDFPFRCGREGLWSLACGRGPNADGSCGGISECLPIQRGDRWLCSRPLSAGGPCNNGPRPDGGCYIRRPPCRPRSSIRARRKHVSFFAFLVSVSVIAAFFATSSGILGFDRNLSIPGELTAAHANLLDGNRCSLCHEAHDREGLALVTALVEYQDISAKCINCHAFEGHARQPHNAASIDEDHIEPLGCVGCHTEHKGAEANIAALPDQDCHQCHQAKAVFGGFSGSQGKPHPPFNPSYGHPAEPVIRFDHAKHFDAHFKKAEHQDNRPETCEACHSAASDGADITMPSFEEGCAGCHENQIRDQPLLLLAWPEMEQMKPPSAEVADACRTVVSWDPEDFESSSFELPGLIESFLMGVDPDDMSSYGAAYQKLARALVLDGVQPLADLIEAKGGDADMLLAGLSPETVARPACDWLSNEEYEGFGQFDAQGWAAEPLALSYRPQGHADQTLKAWLDYGQKLDPDADDQKIVADLKASLLDDETGPGTCLGCHRAHPNQVFQWQTSRTKAKHTLFKHQPHLILAKAADQDSCNGCHKFAQTEFETADFEAIDVETCQQCHGKDGVGESCALCHRYHPAR